MRRKPPASSKSPNVRIKLSKVSENAYCCEVEATGEGAQSTECDDQEVSLPVSRTSGKEQSPRVGSAKEPRDTANSETSEKFQSLASLGNEDCNKNTAVNTFQVAGAGASATSVAKDNVKAPAASHRDELAIENHVSEVDLIEKTDFINNLGLTVYPEASHPGPMPATENVMAAVSPIKNRANYKYPKQMKALSSPAKKVLTPSPKVSTRIKSVYGLHVECGLLSCRELDEASQVA